MMAQRTEKAPALLRKDAGGRVLSLPQFTAVALVGALVGLVAVVAIDGITALVGTGDFGGASGWLALILPGLLFFDDIRAWSGYGVRFLVAGVAAVVAVGVGLVLAGLASSWPPIVSGAVGAAVAVLIYAPIWFLGVRWLTGDVPKEAR